MCDPVLYDHPVETIEVVETHISWIVLTGPFAYKVKKPVSLGFLDFSTLDRRKAMCSEELRLNRRLAPELYLDVVPITGSVEHPVLHGTGAAIEYAVKMVQFESGDEMNVRVSEGLPLELVDDLAREVADFHMRRAQVCGEQEFSTPEQVRRRIDDNFAVLRPHVGPAAIRRLDHLQTWVDGRLSGLSQTMQRRKSGGYVRECHGDLHLGNMVVIGGRVRLFDCLEFNPQMRWIDVASEVAFVVMDFDYQGYREYGCQFLNSYLVATGDYAGLELLPLYLVYRAMVRAKVACIRSLQTSGTTDFMTQAECHLALACHYTDPPSPRLFITHGYSGSGKSWWSGRLARKIFAIHIRSDVERIRKSETDGDAGAAVERYSADNIARNYRHLLDLAGQVLRAGYSVIVDATFLLSDQRNMFYALARHCCVVAVVLDIQCDERLLRTRISRRAEAGEDPSEATVLVLEKQLRGAQPLSDAEKAHAIAVRSDRNEDIQSLLARISGIS